MLVHSTELSTSARYDELPALMAFVAQQAEKMGSSATAILRYQLVLEELFSNTIDHGYSGESDQPIHVALHSRRGGLTLIYRDQAPAFDLTQVSSSQKEDQLGGLGINLILGMAHAVRYRRTADGNLIELDL
jgi:serine/threonine-protein kinase RsbW